MRRPWVPAFAGTSGRTSRTEHALVMRKGPSWFNIAALALGLAFLYLPIAVLVIYSFNASRLVTVWGGFSLRWYAELLADQPLIDSAMMSLSIAGLSASAATVLGTLAAVALVRIGAFRGRTAFSGMIYAPLVMPEVITGLSLLLLFVAVDLDRGFWTVTIAHTTLTLSFVAVVVQSRLLTFDVSLEEAAMDLGAPPLRTFRTITLPLIWPAVAAGWMLAFTLSLDDLVIASFTTGPGATTLPIRIYSQVRLGVKPEINAVCTIFIAVIAAGVVTASLLIKRSLIAQERTAALRA
jgi:putrescine transport system permease protein